MLICKARVSSKSQLTKVAEKWREQTNSARTEAIWRGPGVYGFSGYYDDDGISVAVVEKQLCGTLIKHNHPSAPMESLLYIVYSGNRGC